MKAFKIIIAIVVGMPVLFFAIATILPKTTHVERSIDISASSDAVFYLVSRHRQFQRWSPWNQLDPEMKVEYFGPETGIGSKISWSGNESVGQGTSVYTVYEPNRRAVTAMDFGAMGGGTASYDIEELDGGVNRVTWSFDSDNRNVMEKYFGLFMDSILGPIYQQGLLSLKKLAENLEPIVTERMNYEVNGKQYSGYLAYPLGTLDPLPAVVIVHGIWGQTAHEQKRARMLAELGYVALALDLYGGGRSSDDMQEAIGLMDAVGENTDTTVALFSAALEQLQSHHTVDAGMIAAVGFSVGGPIALNMARRGKNLIGVASFYGGFGGLSDISAHAFTPSIIFNGLSDEFSVPQQRENFELEMNAAKLPYDIVDYPEAGHGFSNPASDQLGEKADIAFIKYNAEADEDSWQRFAQFLNNVFYP